MSSRLTPPKEGCRNLTVSMIFSGSFVPRQIGYASTPPRYLNRRDLPSMTGMPASGPMSPRPKTLVPSDMTPTVFHRFVCMYDRSLFLLMALHGSATPGVYQIAKSLKSLTAHLETISILPA